MMKRICTLLCAVLLIVSAAVISFAAGEGQKDPPDTGSDTAVSSETDDPGTGDAPQETDPPADTTISDETAAPPETTSPVTTAAPETTAPPVTEETTSRGTYIPDTVVFGEPESFDTHEIAPVIADDTSVTQPSVTRSPEDTVYVDDSAQTVPDGDGILLWQDQKPADPQETQESEQPPRSHSASAVLTAIGIAAACAVCITGVLLLYRYIFPNFHRPKS